MAEKAVEKGTGSGDIGGGYEAAVGEGARRKSCWGTIETDWTGRQSVGGELQEVETWSQSHVEGETWERMATTRQV